MEELSVLKFGGSSATQPENMAEIVQSNPERNRVVVMSAIGIRQNVDEQKVTGVLRDYERVEYSDPLHAQACWSENTSRHLAAYRSLGASAVFDVLNDMSDLRSHGPFRFKQREDAEGHLWRGEDLSARLFAKLIDGLFVLPQIVQRNGVIDVAASVQNCGETLAPLLDSSKTLVVPGFTAWDSARNKIVAMNPGASDTTLVLCAAGLNRSTAHTWMAEKWTDADGVMTADPRRNPNAESIVALSHADAIAISDRLPNRNGVVLGDALDHASQLGVQMRVRNSYNREFAGTLIGG